MNVIQLLIFVELSWRDKNAIQGKGKPFRLRAKQITCCQIPGQNALLFPFL